jgi:hypothetical protein
MTAWIPSESALARKLLQRQSSTLAASLGSRRVVSLGISPGYVRDWTAATFQELYQNWYVSISSAGHTLNQTGKTPSWRDFISTAKAFSLSLDCRKRFRQCSKFARENLKMVNQMGMEMMDLEIFEKAEPR